MLRSSPIDNPRRGPKGHIEVKGHFRSGKKVKNGLSREHVTLVDSHRPQFEMQNVA